MTVLVELPHSFRETFPLRATEWQLATIMTGIGLMSLLYPDIFQRTPALSVLLRDFSQPVWGWGMTLVGGIGWFALVRNGAWKRSPMVRTVCATLRGIIWSQIFLSFAGTELATWGLVFFSVFALSEFYNAFRATTDFIKQRRALIAEQ